MKRRIYFLAGRRVWEVEVDTTKPPASTPEFQPAGLFSIAFLPLTGKGPLRRGDCNDDGKVDIADPICLISALYAGGPAPPCADAADSDGDAKLSAADVTLLLGYIFFAGPPPAEPFPGCGMDPNPDALRCDARQGCR